MKTGKSYVKVLCLTMILSLMVGFGGCALLLQNMKNMQNAKQENGSTADNGAASGEDDDGFTEDFSIVEDVLKDEEFNDKLELIAEVVDQLYLNDVSKEDIQEGMFRGLLAGLGDPYSGYYTAEEYRDLMESTNGVYCGIGAVVQQNINTMLITVVNPFVNGPAYKAGMLPGDIIYKVDDLDVTAMDINSVVAMMKGEANTIVEVTVLRDGVEKVLTITRDFVEVETITHEMLDFNIGLITITEFDEVTIQQFKDAITDLKEKGMEGLVIDLRDNPGGLLNAVVEMLDYILPEGMIVYTEDKYGYRDEYRATDADVLEMPIVVMINENSASASEIFAAAMQDYEAATIVGTTSFGKGIVQSIYPVSWVASQLGYKGFENDGSAVKVTISYYYSPNGRCIHGTGVTPDMEVELDEELRQMVVIPQDQDNQLAVAIAVLLNEIK